MSDVEKAIHGIKYVLQRRQDGYSDLLLESEVEKLLAAYDELTDNLTSEGEEWAVVDVLNDRKITFTSYDSYDPEDQARKLYNWVEWEAKRLTKRKIVKYDAQEVESTLTGREFDIPAELLEEEWDNR